MRVYVCNVSGCVCAYEQDGANVETNGLRPSVSLPAFPAPPVSHVGACVIVSEQMLGLSILHRFSFSLRLFLLAPFPPHPSFSLPQHNPVKQVLSSQTCHLRFRLKHNCNPPAHVRGCCRCRRLEGDDFALESLFHAEEKKKKPTNTTHELSKFLLPGLSATSLILTGAVGYPHTHMYAHCKVPCLL